MHGLTTSNQSLFDVSMIDGSSPGLSLPHAVRRGWRVIRQSGNSSVEAVTSAMLPLQTELFSMSCTADSVHQPMGRASSCFSASERAFPLVAPQLTSTFCHDRAIASVSVIDPQTHPHRLRSFIHRQRPHWPWNLSFAITGPSQRRSRTSPSAWPSRSSKGEIRVRIWGVASFSSCIRV